MIVLDNKLILNSILCLVLTLPSFGQTKNEAIQPISIGLTYSPFGTFGVLSIFDTEPYSSFSSKSFYSFGLVSYYKINSAVGIEIGIYYTYHQIEIIRDYYNPVHDNISKIEIPLSIRFERKYFYVSSGFVLTTEIDNSGIIENQSGIGINTSLGFGIDIFENMYLYAGPRITAYSWLPFSGLKDFEPMYGISSLFGFRIKL